MVYGIIAAGEGSRLKADGYQGCKPMVTIAGEALIQRLLRIFTSNHATAIYIILNTSEKEVGGFIKGLPLASQIPVQIIYKDTPSSFHSFYALVRHMAPEHRTEVCISTIDPIFSETAFKAYVANFLQHPELDGLMAVTSYVEDDKPLHVYVDKNDRILQFASTMGDQEQHWISGGVYMFREKALAASEPAMAADVSKMRHFQQFLLDQGLYLKAHDLGKIIDIDHISDIHVAEAFIHSSTIKRP